MCTAYSNVDVYLISQHYKISMKSLSNTKRLLLAATILPLYRSAKKENHVYDHDRLRAAIRRPQRW